MEYRLASTDIAAASFATAGPALIAYGLWLRVAFIGASGFAAGLIGLFNGDVKPLLALALAAGGAAMAVAGGWRARIVLDAADGAPSVATPVTRPLGTPGNVHAAA